MQLARPRIESGVARTGLCTLLALAASAVIHLPSAQALADPDFWKQTAERQDTVNRARLEHLAAEAAQKALAAQTDPTSQPGREAAS